MSREAQEEGVGSTAAVLWLMIALVFLPIALAHVAALLLGGDAGGGP